MPWRVATSLPLLVALGCAGAAPPPPDPAAPSAGLALLVGVDEYAPSLDGALPPLAGAEHDVQRVRAVLVERFGFRAQDVVVLTGADATHAAIVRQFDQHLIRRSAPGTRVVFWFSGHGSRAPDWSGVESSKTEDPGDGAYDNSLLAYDSRAQDLDGAFDLVDDELHALLAALARRTDQVLVVTDCCHSSGAVRGGAPSAPGVRMAPVGRRAADRAALAAFWPASVPLRDDDDLTAAELSCVHIAACAEHQEAGEVRVGGRSYGTLTWFLCDALERIEPGVSWRELVERVRARVAGYGSRPDQTVVGAGDLDREVFGGGCAPPLPGFRVDIDADGDGLGIEAGRAHGVVDGAVFEIVALDGAPRGSAEATRVDAVACRARWRVDGRSGTDGEVLRALPAAAALRLPPLRVQLEHAADADALHDFPYATPAADDQAEYRLRSDARGRVLLDASGRAVRPVPADAAGLRAALCREYTFRGLWECVAQPGTWPLALAAVPADAATQALAAARGLPLAGVVPVAGASTAVVTAVPLTADDGGSLLTLRATNRADRSLRLSILSVGENREVNVVWPRRGQTDRVLRPGESVALPVLVGPAADWGEPRPMVDRYLAFGTVEPADFTPFTSAAPVWTAQRGAAPAVPGFLQRLLGAAPTRGGDASADGFGFGCCDLLLAPPVVDGGPGVR
jgi:hypothetical protein